ncbi:hypothetical protein JB92DRAFT_2729389, partial [Gautieria morchelliformis]
GSTLALQLFKDTFRMNNLSTAAASNISNILSVFQVQGGCFFGVLLALPISDRYGHRLSLIISTIVFTIGSLLQTFANGSLNMMYAGRTFNGFGVGSATSMMPVFIAEFSPPAVRGRVVGISEIMYQIGALVGKFRINYGTAWHIPNSSTAQWRIPIAVQIIPGSVLFVSMLTSFLHGQMSTGHTSTFTQARRPPSQRRAEYQRWSWSGLPTRTASWIRRRTTSSRICPPTSNSPPQSGNTPGGMHPDRALII